jgi:phosphoglycolate phosphatase-like HAD superfamily hydrolase
LTNSDTPNDVEAALTAGVRVIGVATGTTSMEELRTAGADTVLSRLQVQTVVEALNHPGSTT